MALRKKPPADVAGLIRDDRFVALVEDDRAFDVQCVRSALTFTNLAWRKDPGEAKPAAAASEFAWVPTVLKFRARIGGFPASNLGSKIPFPGTARTIEIAEHLGVDLVDAVIRAADGGAAKDSLSYFRTGEQEAEDRYVDERLKRLEISQRVRFERGRARRVSIPLLRDLDTCTAYALAVLVEDRWGLMDRVRLCKYKSKPDEFSHFFLDYRVDAGGRLKRGTPQEFCSEQHANAFHQREWRRRQTDKLQAEEAKRKPGHKPPGG